MLLIYTLTQGAMTVNKYRLVEYTGDGHSDYQCLACKQHIPTARNYCCNCGIKFEGGIECRTRDIPRWAWDRYRVKHPEWGYEIQWPKGMHKPKVKGETWMLETCTVWQSDDNPTMAYIPEQRHEWYAIVETTNYGHEYIRHTARSFWEECKDAFSDDRYGGCEHFCVYYRVVYITAHASFVGPVRQWPPRSQPPVWERDRDCYDVNAEYTA